MTKDTASKGRATWVQMKYQALFNLQSYNKIKLMLSAVSTYSFKDIYFTWASTRENLSSVFANNKGADQPAHKGSMISTFVIHLLENIISKLATSEISIF